MEEGGWSSLFFMYFWNIRVYFRYIKSVSLAYT